MSYINACDLAYMKIESGAFSYQTAIRDAVREIGEKGAYVMYPSGARARVDAAVRRAVLTGVNQTAGQLQIMRADEIDCDLMEISAHFGARPSHAEWQGEIVSRSGKGGYLSLDDIGYGRADGFMGVNCRHNWYMYFEGNLRIYSQEQLDEYRNYTVTYNDEVLTDYEASQKQRTMERAVREKKRGLVGINTAIAETEDEKLKEELKKDFERQSVKLKQREQKLADFCSQTQRRADTFRTQVYGFDRSVSGRAVWAAQQHYDIWRKSIGADDTPKMLAKYYDMKYNNKKEYGLLEQYAKSVKKGMITPLCTYSNFKALHERIENEIIGIVTSDGYEIKAQSKHFIERVVGTMADPTKAGTPIRNGVEIEDIKDALLNPVTEPSVLNHKE